jgi:hypothetical protein
LDRAARVHIAARRRGDVAARGGRSSRRIRSSGSSTAKRRAGNAAAFRHGLNEAGFLDDALDPDDAERVNEVVRNFLPRALALRGNAAPSPEA